MNDEDELVVAGKDGRARTSSAGHERLLELADVLYDCRRSFLDTTDAFHWIAQPGSSADGVAAALPSPDPLLATTRPETGHRLITEGIRTHLQTSAGLIGALGALYQAGEVFAAPGSLVRGALESLARVFWIIGSGTEYPEQLLARAYLEELLSAEEAKKAAKRMGGEQALPYLARERMWRDLRSEILHRFPSTTAAELGDEGGRELAAERLASPSGAVKGPFPVERG